MVCYFPPFFSYLQVADLMKAYEEGNASTNNVAAAAAGASSPVAAAAGGGGAGSSSSGGGGTSAAINQSPSHRYMAPELYRKEKKYTEKVDIYSFGMIMFQLFAPDGQAPFASSSPSAAAEAAALRHERPVFPAKWPPMQELRDLVTACWNADPKARPTAQKCCEVLEKLFPDDGKPSAPLAKLLDDGTGGCVVM
jgi:serine/threonine protein kinase